MSRSVDVLETEKRTIDFIPPEERHGRRSGLFTIWFAANCQATTAVTGALAVLLGLSIGWAITAIVIGNAIGAIFMAAHSAQGPKLGIPQMIQSRAQFGFYGAILPLVLVILMYIGFFASSTVLCGDLLTAWVGTPTWVGIIVGAVGSAIIAIYGYDLVHRYMRWMSVLSGVAFAFLTFRLATTHNLAAVSHTGTFQVGIFILAITLAATWQITYAPYVADYSRYLPKETPISLAFGLTYAGSFIGSTWIMILGCYAIAASKTFGTNPIGFLVNLSPGFLWVFFLIVLGGLVGSNVTNLYGGFMSSTTTFTAIRSFKVTRRTRLEYVVVLGIIGCLLAIVGSGNFFNNFENLIFFLAYLIIPWTAINLVDFYITRKGHYNIPAIFDPHGQYGKISWRAVVSYLVAIAVEVPFVSSSFYVGPMVHVLDGADISWVLAIIVAGGLYFFLMRQKSSPAYDSSVVEPTELVG
ncbi:MAG: cytosine permease [Candidatus Dormiibacterota bacterium]